MTQTSGKLDRSTVLALVAMALGVFVIANDFTALSVAILGLSAKLEGDVADTGVLIVDN